VGYERVKTEHAGAKNGGGAWMTRTEAKESARRRRRQIDKQDATALGAEMADTLVGVTTREKVEKLLDRLSEDELAAEYQRLRQAVESERVDDWGDLERFSARASRGVLRHMTEDEERAGLSWEEFRPQ
jgi:hypothetical protein